MSLTRHYSRKTYTLRAVTSAQQCQIQLAYRALLFKALKTGLHRNLSLCCVTVFISPGILLHILKETCVYTNDVGLWNTKCIFADASHPQKTKQDIEMDRHLGKGKKNSNAFKMCPVPMLASSWVISSILLCMEMYSYVCVDSLWPNGCLSEYVH